MAAILSRPQCVLIISVAYSNMSDEDTTMAYETKHLLTLDDKFVLMI